MSDSVRKGGRRRRGAASLLPASVTARTVLSVSAVAIVAMLVGIACGGGDSSTPTPLFAVETFTPTPPDHTPEALITREAQQTAWAQTATAQPRVTATPRGPESTQSAPPGATPGGEVEIRPPDLFLDTNGGQAQAAVGSFNWCSIEANSCADIGVGYITLVHDSITWSAGTPGTITAPNTPVPPLTTDVALYVHDENAVIPQDRDGRVIGDDLAFVPLVEPLQRETISGSDITLTPNVPPGKYILSVNVNWTQPEGAPLPLHTQYAFVVEIQ